MTPAAIIQKARTDGVILALSPSGSIKATGDQSQVDKWLPAIRNHKADIISALREAANDPPALLSGKDEACILDWLSRIGEADPVTIGEVIDRCRADDEARRYFIGRATEDRPAPQNTFNERTL